MQFGPFGPMRRRAAQRHAPHDQDPPEGEQYPGQRDPASELIGQAFTVSDIGGNFLPTGWSVDEEGYFQLDTKNYHDYWEIRAGCLIRHHLQPRHRPHDITKTKNCPLELKQLDPVRVTLMRLPNAQITTDRYDTVVPASKSSWTGITIYQINGATRKELAIFSTAPAKKVARQAKHAIIKKKPTSELNERGLTMMERE